jgi:hypothetical protein
MTNLGFAIRPDIVTWLGEVSASVSVDQAVYPMSG